MAQEKLSFCDATHLHSMNERAQAIIKLENNNTNGDAQQNTRMTLTVVRSCGAAFGTFDK
jgi:hypothetical protein